MDNSNLGTRMKEYENVNRNFLTKRVPVIIRVDGKAFYTLTRKLWGKKYNYEFTAYMMETALAVIKEIQGCKLCYCQSDEISFLLTDYSTINTQGWFGSNLNKLVSISAAIASASFTNLLRNGMLATFDSRAFNIPQDEVCNYFIWRQNDALRNAIQMVGQEHFSHKELHKKSCNEIQEMLFKEKGINFNNYLKLRKRGFCVVDGEIDNCIPVFTKDRNYIEKFVNVRED